MFKHFAAIVLSLSFGLVATATAEDCQVEGTGQMKTMPHKLGDKEETIMELERQTCRLIKAGKIDELMDDYIAPHGVILLDKGGIAEGREAQREMFKGFFEAGFNIIYEPADARVSESGDMAWAIGAYRLTTPNGEVEMGKYTSIWERSDGKWMNVIEMRNASATASMD